MPEGPEQARGEGDALGGVLVLRGAARRLRRGDRQRAPWVWTACGSREKRRIQSGDSGTHRTTRYSRLSINRPLRMGALAQACSGNAYNDDTMLCLTQWTSPAQLSEGCKAALPKKEEKKDDDEVRSRTARSPLSASDASQVRPKTPRTLVRPQ